MCHVILHGFLTKMSILPAKRAHRHSCPYVNIRELTPITKTNPHIVYQNLQLGQSDHLPDKLISFIYENDDAVSPGTGYVAPPESMENFPSHLGMNHRGGPPDFIRIRPSDGRTVVLPDFSGNFFQLTLSSIFLSAWLFKGNRSMTSLGNVEVTPLTSLTFINFVTGDIIRKFPSPTLLPPPNRSSTPSVQGLAIAETRNIAPPPSTLLASPSRITRNRTRLITF